jgi:putative addiction module component (TIGR02574 family)
MSVILDKALELPIPARIRLVEDIWDSIAFESGAVELTIEQRAELDRRTEDCNKNPEGNVPWDEIKAEALSRK